MLPNLNHLFNVIIRSASENNLQPLELAMCSFTLGQNHIHFIVCKHLQRSLILGIDFIKLNRIGSRLSPSCKFILNQDDQVLIETVDIQKGWSKSFHYR